MTEFCRMITIRKLTKIKKVSFLFFRNINYSDKKEISIQSISQSREENNFDGQTDGLNTSLDELIIKYEKIIENCELHAINERY